MLCDTFEPVAIRFKLGVVRYVSSLVLCDTFEPGIGPVVIRFKLGVQYVSSLVLNLYMQQAWTDYCSKNLHDTHVCMFSPHRYQHLFVCVITCI